jgi:hypothetical protein
MNVMVKVKICCISSIEEASLAIAQGAAQGSIVETLCMMFAQDNKEFNEERFKVFLRTKINAQLETIA